MSEIRYDDREPFRMLRAFEIDERWPRGASIIRRLFHGGSFTVSVERAVIVAPLFRGLWVDAAEWCLPNEALTTWRVVFRSAIRDRMADIRRAQEMEQSELDVDSPRAIRFAARSAMEIRAVSTMEYDQECSRVGHEKEAFS